MDKVTGSLQKKGKSKNWQAVIRYTDPVSGKVTQKWKSTGTVKKSEANKILVALINEYETQFFTDKPKEDILFVDLLKNWRDAFDNIEATTIEGYENNFRNHIIPYFEAANLKLCDLKRKDIQEYVNFKGQFGRLDGAGGLSKMSVRKAVSNISKVLEYAVIGLELIEHNPCTLIRYPVSVFSKQEHEPRHLGLESLTKLLEHVTSDNFLGEDSEYVWPTTTGIVLAICYALRRGEIYGIRWRDVDFDNNMLRIDNTIVRIASITEKQPKNKASRCAMPLIPSVKEYLLQLKARQAECAKFYGKQYQHNDYIVKRDNGEQIGMDYLNKRLQMLLEALEQPIVTLHELRHSTGTYLRSIGFSTQQIQSWLRHADIKSTMHYAHDTIELKTETANRMDSTFAQVFLS